MERSEILPYLHQIEYQEGISIIGAWEVGSRSVGWNTDSSDYDVRFVYTQPKERYISGRDFIESLDSDFHTIETTPQSDISYTEVEYMGWDVKKFFDMIYEGKYTAVDCLLTPEYISLPNQTELQEYVLNKVNPINVFYNFRSSIEGVYTKYIQSGKDSSAKRVLLLYQDILRANYVKETQEYPPLLPPFKDQYITGMTPEEIETLEELKKTGDGDKNVTVPHKQIQQLIQTELDVEAYLPVTEMSRPKLDSYMHRMV